ARRSRRNAVDAAQARPEVLGRLDASRVGPVVELAFTSPRGEAADVRALLVGPLELLLGCVVVVPVVLFGNAEVDERPAPEVRKSHCENDFTRRRGRFLRERTLRPHPRRRGSPDSCPSTARGDRASRRARGGGGSTAATPRGP